MEVRRASRRPCRRRFGALLLLAALAAPLEPRALTLPLAGWLGGRRALAVARPFFTSVAPLPSEDEIEGEEVAAKQAADEGAGLQGRWLAGVVEKVNRQGIYVDVQLPDGREEKGIVRNQRFPLGINSNKEAKRKYRAGQAIRVRVLGPGKAGKLLLSMLDEVDVAAFRSIPPELALAGKVERVFSFGFFVSVAQPPGLGLVHASKVPADLVPVDKHVNVGQQVSVWFSEVDENGELQFTMTPKLEQKPLVNLDDTREAAVARPFFTSVAPLPSERDEIEGEEVTVEEAAAAEVDAGLQGRWLAGVVEKVNAKGICVDVQLPDGREEKGMVRNKRFPLGINSNKEAKRTYRAGQAIRVRVLGPGKAGTLLLSMLEEVDVAAFRSISPELALAGKVERVRSFGLEVRVAEPPGLGFVRISKVPVDLKPVKEHFKVDQQVSVWFLEVDENGELYFTMTPKSKQKPLVNLGDTREEMGASLDVGKDQSSLAVARPFSSVAPLPGEGDEIEEVAAEWAADVGAALQGRWLAAVVEKVTSKGICVDVQLPGIVSHNNVARGINSKEEAKRTYKAGQAIRVRVLGPGKTGKLPLSMLEEVDVAAFRSIPPELALAGKVERLLSFGFFVSVAKPPGLGCVHASQVPADLLPVKEHFKVDQQVSVWFLGVSEKGHLQFTMTPKLEQKPLANLGDTRDEMGTSPDVGKDQSSLAVTSVAPLPGEGDEIEGKEVAAKEAADVGAGLQGRWLAAVVEKVKAKGICVDVQLPDGREEKGIVGIKRFPLGINSKEEAMRTYKAGQALRVRVLTTTPKGLLLSMLDEGDIAPFCSISPELALAGKVERIFSFGLHVRVAEPPGLGFVHINKVPVDLRPVKEHFKVDQQVSVWFLGVDENGELRFTMKPKSEQKPLANLGDAGEEIGAFLDVGKDQWLTGLITALNLKSSGLYVDLQHPTSGKSALGLVPSSKMAFGEFKVGQKVRVRVERVDFEQSILGLTMREAADLAETSKEDWNASTAVKATPFNEHGTSLQDRGNAVLQQYGKALREQGYDIASLKHISRQEWEEMKLACSMRPGDAAKLRVFLHPDWA